MNTKCKKCNGFGTSIHNGVCKYCGGTGFIKTKN